MLSRLLGTDRLDRSSTGSAARLRRSGGPSASRESAQGSRAGRLLRRGVLLGLLAAPWLAPAANAVPSAAAPAATAAPAKVATPNTATPNATTTVLVVGDSLSAEYGLPRGTGWVALLSRRLAEQHSDYSVRNASISGDTTSGGRARLAALLARERPAVVILELGGNDALRGVPLATSRNNLAAMIEASQRAGARVVLVGMQIPPNYGPTYARDFSSMYPALAKEKAVMLVPFLLEGMADDPTMFQPDQIHPTVAAQARLLDNVWPVLRPLLKAKR